MVTEKILLFLTLSMVFGVAFVNGWTDAPNAIASAVSSRSLSMKSAVVLAAVSDFMGAIIIGIFNGKVTETIINMASFGDDSKIIIIALCSSMLSVIAWAVIAWKFGIPTSESHALIASIAGASIAVNDVAGEIDLTEWSKVFSGLVISVLLGFAGGWIISKITVLFSSNRNKHKSDKFFKAAQIVSSMFMAFMHGAQDSQKFTGILFLVLGTSGYDSSKISFSFLLIITSLIISLGTAFGGGRIIKSVGLDIVKLRKDQGFSADLAGAVCLLVSTVFGMPVSTTHTKTSAVIGVGSSESLMRVNWKKACEMIMAWLLTFPACFLESVIITRLFLFLFGGDL